MAGRTGIRINPGRIALRFHIDQFQYEPAFLDIKGIQNANGGPFRAFISEHASR